MNNYPYTNTHDLNLDWILKQVKGIDDKYKDLDSTIAAGVAAVQQQEAVSLQDLNNQKLTIVAAINGARDIAIGDVNESKNTALAAIAALGNTWDAHYERLIAEMPADLASITQTLAILGRILTGNSVQAVTFFMGDYAGGSKTDPVPTSTSDVSTNMIIGGAGLKFVFTLDNAVDANTKIYAIRWFEGKNADTGVYTGEHVVSCGNVRTYTWTVPDTCYGFSITLRNNVTWFTAAPASNVATLRWFTTISDFVSVDGNQNFTDTQKAQGRENIGAASENDLAQSSALLLGSDSDINYAVISTATKTHNGLSFSAVNGTVTVNGTSMGVAFFDLFRSLTAPNEFPLKKGHTYVLRFADEVLSPLIYKQVEYKVSSTSQITSLYSKNLLSDYVVFTVPDSFYDFYVRLVCDRAGETYANKTISFSIEEITDKKDVIVVDIDGGGDFTSLKAGIEYAMLKYGTKVIVKRGQYNLVNEFGESYLDNLSGNDFGIMLGNGIELIFAPNAYVSFDYDGANSWIIQNFSPFNTDNNLGYTIDGLHCTARNCRYILHDDPRPGVKNRYSKNVIRNCYFELFPSPEYPSWVNHQIIGGGLGDSTMIEIENCIFNDHFTGVVSYSSVSYHNSTSGSMGYESRIIVKDCYFADGNKLVFEGYGASPYKTKVIATNNNLTNGDDSIIYNNTQADNMTVYKWNNHART